MKIFTSRSGRSLPTNTLSRSWKHYWCLTSMFSSVTSISLPVRDSLDTETRTDDVQRLPYLSDWILHSCQRSNTPRSPSACSLSSAPTSEDSTSDLGTSLEVVFESFDREERSKPFRSSTAQADRAGTITPMFEHCSTRTTLLQPPRT